MINIKPLILAEIDKIGIPVFFFYPSDWAKLPCISYYEASNTEYLRTDDEEQLSEINIQIDIWADKPSENSELALKVDERMDAIGFVRQFCGDLFNDGIYHKTMRYRAIVDKEKKYVYQ